MRVAIADDSALFRDGLCMILTAAGIDVTVQARSGGELIARIGAVLSEAVVLDIRMPPTFTDEGLRTAHEIRERFPGVGVLVLSTYAETAYAVQLLTPGQDGVGYLLKDRVDDVHTLVDALQRVARAETVVDPDIVRRLFARRRNGNSLERLTERGARCPPVDG